MAEDAKSADGIAEASGDAGRLLVDKEGGPGYVLALQGERRGAEELLVGRSNYLICRTGLHISIMLQNIAKSICF
jgi:hypothetical protein